MKRFIILLSLVVLFSCTKENNYKLGKTPSAVMSEAISQTRDLLCSSEKGWVMEYFPGTQKEFGGYNVLLRFDKNGEVTVASDLISDVDSTATSPFRIRESAGVVLSFDLYNKIFHQFSDPNNSLGVGVVGSGYNGDYEFSVLSATPDLVLLKGKKYGSRVVMRPYTSDKSWTEYLQLLKETKSKISEAVLLGLSLKDTTCFVTVSQETNTINVSYNEAGAEVNKVYSFLVSENSIRLASPINIKGINDSVFVYDSAQNLFMGENSKLERIKPTPTQVYKAVGPWSFTFSNLSPYLQSLVKLISDRTFKGTNTVYGGADYKDNRIYYFFLAGSAKNDFVRCVIFPRYQPMPTHNIVSEPINGNEIELAFTANMNDIAYEFYSVGLLRWFNPTSSYIGSSVFSKVAYTVEIPEGEDEYNPVHLKFTQKNNPNLYFTLTREVQEFGDYTN